jgi:SAM-dependent methyltransferase
MSNPWLDIPLADYEGHMALPAVGQAPLLSDVFAGVLDRHAPRSLAVLGCAGGNGFERIAGRAVARVVGVDINPRSIEQARARFSGRVAGLELIVGDVQTDDLAFEPVELVFAGLLFEYVNVARTLAHIRAMLRPSGTLAAVLQLPNADVAEITPSPFTSLRGLASVMRLASPQRFKELAGSLGYHPTREQTVSGADGKRFHVQELRLDK